MFNSYYLSFGLKKNQASAIALGMGSRNPAAMLVVYGLTNYRSKDIAHDTACWIDTGNCILFYDKLFWFRER